MLYCLHRLGEFIEDVAILFLLSVVAMGGVVLIRMLQNAPPRGPNA